MPRLRYFALALALAGYWLPWLTHPAAALRLNGYELSEWITFLPGVRDGSLPLSRLTFLMPLACLALLCGLAAARPASDLVLPPLAATRRLPPPRSGLTALLPPLSGPAGWALLVLGLVLSFTVIPPYPYVLTAYADREYQTQLFVGGLTLLAMLVVAYLPRGINALLQSILAATAAALGLWAVLILRPAANVVLNAQWSLGLGWFVMLAGFAGLILSALASLFGPRA